LTKKPVNSSLHLLWIRKLLGCFNCSRFFCSRSYFTCRLYYCFLCYRTVRSICRVYDVSMLRVVATFAVFYFVDFCFVRDMQMRSVNWCLYVLLLYIGGSVYFLIVIILGLCWQFARRASCCYRQIALCSNFIVAQPYVSV